jgi:hypothetical protein
MKNFIFIDLFTQKGFIENFGSQAIWDCPEIRENLMDVTAVAIRNKIPIHSFMYTGFTDSDFDKVADTETEDMSYEVTDNPLQLLIRTDSLTDFTLPELDYSDKVIFIYGVPAEISAKNFVKKFVSKFAKVWIVQDAIKVTNSNDISEEQILAELKELGAKLITTRNLEKYITI